MEGLYLLFVGFLSLLVMIPIWIAVLILNRLYAKESCPQTQLPDASDNKASNLRRTTIWTTGVMMIATMILPTIWMWPGILHTFYEPVLMTFMMWCLTGSHLFVSFIIAVQVKARISTIILLISTLVYGTVICCAWGWGFLNPHIAEDYGYSIMSIGMWSLTVMIPVWIAALILNWRAEYRTLPPGGRQPT